MFATLPTTGEILFLALVDAFIPASSGGPPDGIELILLRLFVWFGGMVLVIALVTSLLGMIVSMGGSSAARNMGGGGGGGRQGTQIQQYQKNPAQGGDVGAGGSPAGAMTTVPGNAGAAAAGGAVGGAVGSAVGEGGPAVTQSDDGGMFVNPANSDEKAVISDDGVSTFTTDDAATNPDAVPLKEKADHMSGGRLSDAAEFGRQSKNRIEDGAERLSEYDKQARADINEQLSPDAPKTQPKQYASEWVQNRKEYVEDWGQTGFEAGIDSAQAGIDFANKRGMYMSPETEGKVKLASGVVGGVSGAVTAMRGPMRGAGRLGGRMIAQTPKKMLQAGNIAKRGGKAYWSVFKQPDAASSLGETARIARESPIGMPDKPDGSEDGVMDVEESETINEMDMGDGTAGSGETPVETSVSGGTEDEATQSSDDGDQWVTNSDSDAGVGPTTDSETEVRSEAEAAATDETETDVTEETETEATSDVSDDGSAGTSTGSSEAETDDSAESTVEAEPDYGSTVDSLETDIEDAKGDIDDLRNRWDTSAGISNNPYPEYYADSVEQGVEMVEDLPEYADDLREAGIDPEEFAEQMVNHSSTAASTFDGSMGQKDTMDLAAAQGGHDKPDVSAAAETMTTEQLTDFAEASADKRNEIVAQELQEARSAAMEEVQDPAFQNNAANEFEKEINNREFESEEEKLAFQVHASNAAQTIKKSATDDALSEFNDTTRF